MFWMIHAVFLVLVLGTPWVATAASTAAFTGTRPDQQRRASHARAGETGKSSHLRRYEVRTDARSGRLIRTLAKVRGGRRASDGPAKGPGNEIAQRQRVRSRPVDIDSLARQAGERHNVDPKLIQAVMRQESNYDVFAVSPKGARGLMQLMPGTALRFGVKDILDPAENVDGGAKYLRHLLERYDHDASLALAAYNAGEGAVDRYGGIPPYAETADYVERIRAWYGSKSDFVSDDRATNAVRPRVTARRYGSELVVFEME
jgi:soluble lytic murein transglycosylase-like protein